MPLVKIPYNEATVTQRNFAYACAVANGYNPYDSIFWQMFMTAPISDVRWNDLSGVVACIVLKHFKTGYIYMPEGFNNWVFVDGQWESLASV